jgi:hypothetical protein
MYGTVTDKAAMCFYDAKGVIRTADRRLRVWTKCLPEKELDSVMVPDSEIGRRILENTARKIVDKYVPPIAIFHDNIDANQAMAIIAHEEAANLSGIKPSARFFVELNCSEQMTRRLSTYFRRLDGRDTFDDKASNWEYAPPETNSAMLLKMLCPRR